MENQRKMKTMALSAEQLLEEQRATARRASHLFFEGELSSMRWRRVFALAKDLMVMCFASLPNNPDSLNDTNATTGGNASVPIGGGCRLAKLGKEWAAAKTEAEATAAAAASRAAIAEAAYEGTVPILFPSLPWGELHPFSEAVLGRCEVERISNDRFLVCFENGLRQVVSCRLAVLGADTDFEFGPELDAGSGRLSSVAATSGGVGFGVCLQEVRTDSGNLTTSVSCRWGEVSAADSKEVRWTEDPEMAFVFE